MDVPFQSAQTACTSLQNLLVVPSTISWLISTSLLVGMTAVGVPCSANIPHWPIVCCTFFTVTSSVDGSTTTIGVRRKPSGGDQCYCLVCLPNWELVDFPEDEPAHFLLRRESAQLRRNRIYNACICSPFPLLQCRGRTIGVTLPYGMVEKQLSFSSLRYTGSCQSFSQAPFLLFVKIDLCQVESNYPNANA